ncbi:hypothetical protein A9R04_25125 [Nocardiopsis dassonvillei]|uniref:hypothetical protein n=1 Tax=Nocardiopsis dassonvillei TaxID=2014 RepID=UPI0008FC6CAB|nr:hypothetical protein [Nocardiopsis dassonvillei]APC37755.1 hypothetical protein A9R04_25125 [Nocardiopsis dassonvillei]
MNGTDNPVEENVERPRIPLAGILVTAASVVLMVLVSWTAWPDLPGTVLSGRTNLDGTPDTVPRAVLALALPLTTGLLAVVLSAAVVFGTRLQNGLQDALGLPAAPKARNAARGMSALLGLLSLFLLVTHGVLVLGQAGWDLPISRVLGVATGLFLVGVGVVLPAPEPGADHDRPLARWWSAAHRLMRTGFVLVGSAQAAVVLFVDHMLAWLLVPLLLLPAMCAAVVLPLLRGRA